MDFTFNFTGDITATITTSDAYGNRDTQPMKENHDYSIPIDGITLETTGEFVGTPKIVWTDDWANSMDKDFTVNGSTATITFFNPSDVSTATGTINAEAGTAPAFSYNISLNDPSMSDKITSNIDFGVDYNEGDNNKINLTATDGFYFKTIPYIIYQDDYGNELEEFFITDQTTELKTNYYLDIDTVLNTVSGNVNITLYLNVLEIPTEPAFSGYGVLDIYQLNADKLKEIELIDSTAQPLSSFILNLNRLFIDVADFETVEIKLGTEPTGVNADLIKTDLLELDFGTVNITEKYGNANDYINSKIKIFLPFFGFTDLNATDVINKTIKLIYKVNILNGDSAILIYNSDDVLIEEFTCNVGYEIPYFIAFNRETKSTPQGNLNAKNKHLMGFVPYILHEYTEPINSTYKNDFGMKNFNNLTGYYKFDDVDLDQQELLKSEYDEIINLLKEGVIF